MFILGVLFKINLKVVYFFLKFLPTKKNKVLFISRQSNKPSIDFLILEKELRKLKFKTILITKKIEKGFVNYIKYYFNLYKQMYHLATSKVCIIDSYCIPVCILKHKKSLVVIQMWHAMGAIKQFGYQTLTKSDGRNEKVAKMMKMHNNYSYILSGSEAMIGPFSKAFNYPKDSFIINGLPRIDYLLKNRKMLKNKIKNHYPELKKKKNILYVPTFRRNSKIKIDELIANIDYKKFNLIIKVHPATKISLNNKHVFTCSKYSALELLSIADYVITDYSAISLEAASLDIPIFLYLYDYDEYVTNNGLNIDLFKEFDKYASNDIKSIINVINKEKYNINVVLKFKEKYLDKDFGNYTKKLVKFIVDKME